MRAVVQRVREASVTVDQNVTGRIEGGLLVLLGVEEGDTERDAAYIAEKVTGLRIFEDAEDKMNLSVLDVHGKILSVSQFTLLGDVRHGKRPSFSAAEKPEEAKALWEVFNSLCEEKGVPVETGVFQAHMDVRLLNDGPVTILLDSHKLF